MLLKDVSGYVGLRLIKMEICLRSLLYSTCLTRIPLGAPEQEGALCKKINVDWLRLGISVTSKVSILADVK